MGIMYEEYSDGGVGKEPNRKMSQMGVFGWRPKYLEFLNKPIIFVIFFGVGNLFTVLSFGVISVIMTTLESVFNLNSKETAVILLGNDLSGLFASLLLANYASSRKIRWIAIGMFAVVVSALLPASATLFAEYPALSNETSGPPTPDGGIPGLCVLESSGAEYTWDANEEAADYAVKNHAYFWLFVAGSLVLGFGGSPPGIAGPTYMDEIFTQKEFGFAISVLYVITFMGFPLAVLFGGAALNMYVTLSPPEGMHKGRSEWVGAWWLGFLVPGVVIFLLSFVVMLYPRQMPAAKRVLKDKIAKGVTTVSEKKAELHRSLAEITRDTLPAFKRLLTNKSLNFLIFGDALVFLQIGSVSYLPKIYAIAFRLGFSEVAAVLGISNIVAFLLGLIGGGLIMRLKEWHPRKLFLIYATMVLISTPFQASLFLHCAPSTWGGVDVSYPNTLGEPTLDAVCNGGCECTTAFPAPVCSDDVTYFSACYAGCTGGDTHPDDNYTVTQYTNCTCTSSGHATPGDCGTPCQTKLLISLVLSVVGTMINFAGYAAHATVYQRVVSEVDRTIAQGWRQFITRVLGTLPAPIVFGYIIDSSCTVWRVTGDTQGNCWVYDVESLITQFVLLQICLRIGACALYFTGWYLYPEQAPKLELPVKVENNNNCLESNDESSKT